MVVKANRLYEIHKHRYTQIEDPYKRHIWLLIFLKGPMKWLKLFDIKQFFQPT